MILLKTEYCSLVQWYSCMHTFTSLSLPLKEGRRNKDKKSHSFDNDECSNVFLENELISYTSHNAKGNDMDKLKKEKEIEKDDVLYNLLAGERFRCTSQV